MADLKNFKLSSKERLAKAETVPLPPPTIGVTGAFRAKSATPAPASTLVGPETSPPPAPEPAMKAGQGPQPPAKIEKEELLPNPVAPDKPDAGAAAPAETRGNVPEPAAGTLLMFRPLLQFSKSMLPRAEAIAQKLRVGVEMLVRKVANETTVEAVDFGGSDPAPRGGVVYRGRVRIPKDRAEGHLAEVDPLGLQEQGTALRPVCLRAFDRAADKILTDLERKTL